MPRTPIVKSEEFQHLGFSQSEPGCLNFLQQSCLLVHTWRAGHLLALTKIEIVGVFKATGLAEVTLLNGPGGNVAGALEL